MTEKKYLMSTRREMLKLLAGTGVVSLGTQWTTPTAQAIDYDRPVSEADGLTAYCNSQQVLIRLDNCPIAAYRAHNTGKYPYLGSLAGPITGTDLTTESALPYPHHRGVWLGCDPLNGGDYWSDQSIGNGQIRSTGVKAEKKSADCVVVNDACEWVGPNGSSPFKDERTLTVKSVTEHLRTIDVALKLTACEDISIRSAKHSFFALRAAADISPSYGGTLMNSHGDVGAAAVHGKPAAWCSYFGPRRVRPDVVEGIALMDHPANPWSPCPWLARDYGHLSPSPFSFLKKPWRLEQGETIDLRYLIVVHAGDPQVAGLAQVYKNWISI